MPDLADLVEPNPAVPRDRTARPVTAPWRVCPSHDPQPDIAARLIAFASAAPEPQPSWHGSDERPAFPRDT